MERDDYFKSIEADDGQHVNVSSGEIEGAPKGYDQACLLQVGTEMCGYACAYLNDQKVRELITGLTAYLACKKREA